MEDSFWDKFRPPVAPLQKGYYLDGVRMDPRQPPPMSRAERLEALSRIDFRRMSSHLGAVQARPFYEPLAVSEERTLAPTPPAVAPHCTVSVSVQLEMVVETVVEVVSVSAVTQDTIVDARCSEPCLPAVFKGSLDSDFCSVSLSLLSLLVGRCPCGCSADCVFFFGAPDRFTLSYGRPGHVFQSCSVGNANKEKVRRFLRACAPYCRDNSTFERYALDWVCECFRADFSCVCGELIPSLPFIESDAVFSQSSRLRSIYGFLVQTRGDWVGIEDVRERIRRWPGRVLDFIDFVLDCANDAIHEFGRVVSRVLQGYLGALSSQAMWVRKSAIHVFDQREFALLTWQLYAGNYHFVAVSDDQAESALHFIPIAGAWHSGARVASSSAHYEIVLGGPSVSCTLQPWNIKPSALPARTGSWTICTVDNGVITAVHALREGPSVGRHPFSPAVAAVAVTSPRGVRIGSLSPVKRVYAFEELECMRLLIQLYVTTPPDFSSGFIGISSSFGDGLQAAYMDALNGVGGRLEFAIGDVTSKGALYLRGVSGLCNQRFIPYEPGSIEVLDADWALGGEALYVRRSDSYAIETHEPSRKLGIEWGLAAARPRSLQPDCLPYAFTNPADLDLKLCEHVHGSRFPGLVSGEYTTLYLSD